MKIELEWLGGLTDSQKAIFRKAAKRWMEVIPGDLSPVTLQPASGSGGLLCFKKKTRDAEARVTTGILIHARGIKIDGQGGVLGQAGPTGCRIESGLPYEGIMEFDTGDLARMESDGTLQDVILHEMGHVIGIGTRWVHFNLLRGGGTSNPVFIGPKAMKEYALLRRGGNEKDNKEEDKDANEEELQPVPVANTGGPGTAEGHWRESVFDEELMSGYAEKGTMPLSRLTIASLEDMGYEVDYSKADAYNLPPKMAVTGVEKKKDTVYRRSCEVNFPDSRDALRKRTCFCCFSREVSPV